MVPYLRAANITWDGVNVSDVKTMNFTADEVNIYRLLDGDLLLSEASGSPSEVGKPGVWRSQLPENICFQNTLIRVRPKPGVDTEFLRYRLLHECLRGGFARASRGVGIFHIGSAKLAALEMDVPPSGEQARIATLLTGHKTALDRIDGSLTHLHRLTTALRSSLARQFLVTPEDEVMMIADLATVGSGATPLRSDPAFWTEGAVPWLTSGDLRYRQIMAARQFITDRALADTAVRLWPADTLLVAMYGEGQTRGRCARLGFESTTNQACAGIQLLEDAPVSVAFLQGYFEATYHRNRQLAAGGVQPNLSLGLIRQMVVPVRPAAEQLKLVTSYELALDQLASVERSLRQLAAKKAAIWRALLDSAVNGRLPTADETDEPARELLARVGPQPAALQPKAGTVRPGSSPVANDVQETA